MSNEPRTARCPVCRQQVETKDWWALWVPRADTFVVHLVDGVPCRGSNQDVPAGEDTAGIPLPSGEEDTAPVEEETRREVYEPIGVRGLGRLAARAA